MTAFCRYLVLALAGTVFVYGQAINGSISGLVTDKSGASISEAKITVTDVDRNTVFSTISNETGFYLVSQLPIGKYRLTAEKSGFRTYVLDAFPLAAEQRAAINIGLEVGSTTSEVTVAATPQLLDSVTATLSATVSNNQIVDLPLNNRNIYALTSLVPGVFQTKTTSGVDDTFYGNHFIINGSQEATSDIVLDGVSAEVSHNVPTIPAITAIPSVEGIQEFRILTNSYPAEYGRSGGGVVIMVTKSGTNSPHGSGFEFLRNSTLDANNFFANRSGLPLASFKRNQFGGSFGGPIWLPKIYNGKSRSFFFVDYEGMRLRAAQIATYTLPTTLQRQGDFSKTLNAAGQQMVIYNPFSTTPDPNNPTATVRAPFPGNVIPQPMLNPVALNMQKYYPQPNVPGLPFTNANNYAVQSAYPQPANRVEVKIDHYFNAANRIMGRYDVHDSIYSKPNYFNNLADPGCCEPMYQRLQSSVLVYTHTLGASKVLELRGGMGRVAANRVPWSAARTGSGGFDPTQLGLPASIAAQANQLMFPTVTIQDMTQLGPNGGDVYHMWDMAYTGNGNLSWVHGRHSLKFGAEIRLNLVNYGRATNPVGLYQFYRSMTQGPNPFSAASTSGVGYASFLLGTGGGINSSAGLVTDEANPANANRYYALYAQDDFRISSRLTLNAGLRWDIETGDTERYDHQTAIDPYVRNPLSSVTGMDLRGGTLFSGSSLGRRAIIDTPLRNFGPRVGIAYQATPTLVIRSAYGIYYTAAPYGASRHNLGEGYSTQTPWVATIDGANPIATLSNPFPNGFNHFTGSALGLLTQVGATLNDAWPATQRTPYNQQWNFTIQKQFGSGMLWEIAYAGNKATKLPFFQPAAPELDQLNPALLSRGSALLSLVSNPFYGIITTPGILSQPTVQLGQLLRPYPQYTGFQAKNAGWGNANYNALQTRFEKRFARGAGLMVSYTFSKTISGAVDGLWTQAGTVRNWYCFGCERAVSSYDQPHRFVVNGTYELPVGRGHMIAGGANRFVQAALGGWQVNSIVTLAVGLPLYNWSESTSTCFCFGGLQRPDLNGQPVSLGSAQSVNKWFNTAAFSAAAPYTFGNLGRTLSAVRAASAHNVDFSLFKSFKPRERLTAEFRAEAFNLTNTPIFSSPNVTLGSTTFGVVSGQENTPRQIQMGIKLLF
jgi:Carboxypeptidase regulatory-like domain